MSGGVSGISVSSFNMGKIPACFVAEELGTRFRAPIYHAPAML